MSGNVVSLFDYSGVMLHPWRDAGYDCWAVDVVHGRGVVESEGINFVGHDLRVPWLPPFDRDSIVFVAASPPCTHLATSGARWFTGKGLRCLADSVTLFASAAEFCEWAQAPYLIENPVSTISTYWRKPDHVFNPYDYAGWCADDNYKKRTCLWTGGGFVMPQSSGISEEPDNRMGWMEPSEDRGMLRSRTPSGFALAVYDANGANMREPALW